MSEPSTSEAFKFDMTDLKKLGINAALVGLAAGVSVLIDNLGHLNLGPYTALVVPVIGVGLVGLQKWLRGNVRADEAKKE